VEARALLTQRGLTPQLAAEVQALIDEIGAYAKEDEAPPSQDMVAA
jgi:hypothetical protein